MPRNANCELLVLDEELVGHELLAAAFMAGDAHS